LLAATTEIGRRLYASYALVWQLLQHCQKLGVIEYDFMGIDPKNNSGVYNFKKGTGAEFIEYLGEWDWATSNILRWGANGMVRHMRRND
jgi:lipid II:glycine glycyltransferase (peptidoglycan interpeptide bridge formation enzyme)